MSETQARTDVDVPLPARRSNRPVRPIHYIEYGLVRILFLFFGLLGVDRSSSLAGGFLRWLGPKLRSISIRAEDNLSQAFPDWPDDKIKEVTQDVWENLGRMAAEFAHLEKFHAHQLAHQPAHLPDRRITIEGEAALRAIVERQQPVIFVAGHFANWEIISIAAHQAGLKYAFVYRAANNPLVDELIINKRAAAMTRRQIPKGKRGARAIVEAVQSGCSLAMLVDQKLNDGISVPFMGREAMTTPAAARLAIKFNLPVIPISIERLNGAYFKVTIRQAISFDAAGDTDASNGASNIDEKVRALTININQALERDIRARPGQWLWLHRRWPKNPD